MEINRLADLKPRNVWEITDDAFDLYRERFVLLATVSAVVYVPVLLATNGTMAALGYLSHADEGPNYVVRAFRDLGWTVPAMGVAYVLQSSATALAVQDVLTGEESSLASVYKRTFQKILPLVGASLLVSLGIVLSSCLIIGPLFVAIWYAFSPYCILLENRKVFDALKRSRDIALNYFGKTFGLLCLVGLVTYLLSFGFEGLIELGFNLFPKDPATNSPYDKELVQRIVNIVASSLITVISAPLATIAMTLLYYDLRVRREGLDIESEAADWGVELAPDPFGGVLNPKVPKANKAGVKK